MVNQTWWPSSYVVGWSKLVMCIAISKNLKCFLSSLLKNKTKKQKQFCWYFPCFHYVGLIDFTHNDMDRPTIFIEIIQRVGCMLKNEEGKEYQKGGCGGFGKGNFSELFKSIEEYEKTLEAKRIEPEPTAA